VTSTRAVLTEHFKHRTGTPLQVRENELVNENVGQSELRHSDTQTDKDRAT